ncbi:phospholipase A I isoform X1 isoform A [Chlorella sorokiniana]|uniref:Phospholipase A I isoform X1 isoform A n=1 Tax=Chlorella sorokiniana TaxID=3076 RepID=A0A2P6TWQ2_CHLSO|nr:phospholipase A I isoform X1 isoform A [Chlorella sorokiniana]|eukprot:PRW58490.1 phospholipase A I isoform X1 isoform A [Chlorella sorokiniana]
MFSLGSFTSRRPPDAWGLALTFHHESLGQQEREVAWTAGEAEAGVLASLTDTLAAPGLVHEAVHVTLHTASGPLLGVVAAAGFGAPVRLALSVRETVSRLVGVELTRTSGSGTLPTSLALALWQELEAAAVTRLRVADSGAVAALADARVAARFTALRVLNLSNAGLTALPSSVGLLTGLEELRVVGNQLRILPPEIGQLTRLRVLAADSNQLTILPGELRRCEQLEELTLQHNRLTSVLLSFASLRHLSVLHLYDNPLDFLPEISPCSELTHLTVANLRITADQAYTKVEFLPPPPGGGGGYSGISLWDSKQSDRLRPIFALMLRRSSGHHPLLAGALRQLAEEDPKNRELMARQENGLQQLVLMALGDNPVVVEETCRTLALLASHSPALADAVVANDADALLRLLPGADERRVLATLGLLAALAHSSSDASARLATDALLTCLARMVGGEGAAGGGAAGAPAAVPGEEVRTAALKALGNLAFCDENRRRLERRPALMQRLSQLALSSEEPTRVQVAALRVLAILGENELVEQAAGRPPIQGRGVRILSLDGGGMKGMATVRLLRELERHTGKRIWELFDLIVGTSTGGLLAVALGLLKLDMDACDHIYKVLGRKVFSRVVAAKDAKEESWMESFYRTFQSKTSHVRAVVVGYKHDAAVYESLLREYCDFSKEERCIGDTMIDTAVLGPKVALVSTLSSLSPAPPFLFRTYQLPPGSEALGAQIGAHAGSCKHPVWQAVRASSAASFYLEDFTCGGDKFQDGAVTANNPAVIALQEARLLWPDHPIDVLMSVGVGVSPAVRREKGLSSFMETGSILIESATSVSRADEALATLMPLVPGVKYLRFCASDPRCNMELDEVDPERWAQLEAATQEYVAAPATQAQYAEAAAALLQTEAASAAEPPHGSLKLGARRKLLVLRAPRLGAQQLSMDDAVAATLAHRPGCVAAVDLQRLEQPPREATDGSDALPAGQPAGTRHSSVAEHAEVAAPVVAAAAGAGSAEIARGVGSLQVGSGEDEGGGISAYLSSWFGSPTKQAKLASPPAAAEDRAGQQEQLAAALPSVGVVHLGLELAGSAGLVLRWQQQLEAMAEPSTQATALLLEAGLDPNRTRLADVC